jgi:hypothetical protein
MYMQLFQSENVASELKVGKRYQVLGYHTGDFAGVCIEVTTISGVFKVCENGALRRGEIVEVFLAAARGAKVKIHST